MAGTKAGGKKTAETNYKKYGPDFYKKIGAKGGREGHTGGFYWMKQNGQEDRIRSIGQVGGRISRRKKKED